MPCQRSSIPGIGCGQFPPGNCAGAIYGAECYGSGCEDCFFGELAQSGRALSSTPSATATIGTIVIKPSALPTDSPLQDTDIIERVHNRSIRGIGSLLLLQQESPKPVTVGRGADHIDIEVGAHTADGMAFKVCQPGDLEKFGVQAGDLIERINGRFLIGGDDILNTQRERVLSISVSRGKDRREIVLHSPPPSSPSEP